MINIFKNVKPVALSTQSPLLSKIKNFDVSEYTWKRFVLQIQSEQPVKKLGAVQRISTPSADQNT